MKKLVYLFVLLFAISGCSLNINNADSNKDDSNLNENVPTVAPDNSEQVGNVITNTFGDFKISSVVNNAYTKNGNVIKFTKGGEYTVSGTLNGSLVFDSSIIDSVTLFLNNANITASDNHAIYWMKDTGKIEVKAVENTTNTITVKADASKLFSAIESENNIEIGGSGKLTIKGLQRHAVKGSNIEIKGNVNLIIEADKDGLHGKHILISGGNTTIKNCTDAIQADVNSSNLKGTILVEEGTLTITGCKRAFKATVSLTIEQITGSTVTINVNSTSTAVETPTINYVSGKFYINGASYK